MRRLTIEQMQLIATSRGGKCISKKYVNGNTKLEWECAKGHRWLATPSLVKLAKAWCPHCVGRYKTIEDMQEIAKSRGGKCLSKKYVNSKTKLKWECVEGHQWSATPRRVSWCPECATQRSADARRSSIADMRAVAKSRSGKCLSKTYKNQNSILEWECANGHRWNATAGSVYNQGTWCPECGGGISERICRAYFQQIFRNPFPKRRPVWLKNSRGNQMELDGYCKKLKIAFEHQGEQHYKAINFFGGQKKLLQQKEDDEKKRILCGKNGVRLICVPELFAMTKLEDFNRFIYDECIRLKIRRPAGMLERKINLKNAWSSDHAKEKLKQLQKVAKAKGGKCIADKYVHSTFKLKFECSEGHQWDSVPDSVLGQGTWCPWCLGLHKTIKDMQEIAKARGGKCLSKKYVSTHRALQWECSEGHRWKTAASNVQTGTWCPKCADKRLGEARRLDIDEMHEIAEERGGKCISKKYVSAKSKLEWECAKGHRWKATGNKVKNVGRWCPVCGGSLKKTIEEMQELAKSRGGKCLSKKYVNSKVNLEWQCEKGHRWLSTADLIHGGSWCHECAGNKKLTLEDMQAIAKEYGGKCLSKKYVNIGTDLEWQCVNGHRWKSPPRRVKHRGHWCQECKKKS